MWFDLNRYSPAVLRSETRQLWGLAWPMLLGQIAAVGVGVVDTMMAGGAGKADLTAVSLGTSVFVTVFVTLLGIINALNPIIAQLFGAGKQEEIGEMGRQGLWFGTAAGVAGMLLQLALIRPLLAYVDMGAEVEGMLADYLFYTALSLPLAMVYRVLYGYVSSLNRPQAVMWFSWAGLLLNIPLNYVFVYGKLGLPAMGGAGCGVATLLVFALNAAALWLYVLRTRYFDRFGLTARFSLPDKAALKQIWQLGWPIALSYFLEISLFSAIVWLIADLGADTVAAQQIVLNISSMSYMVPSALGSAATVRIGQALGRRQFARARYLGGMALVLGAVSAVCIVAVLVGLRAHLPALYTDDAGVLALAAVLMLFAAVFQVFDCTQCIASYALRGYKITRLPMLIHALCFWGLGLLPGYWLAYGAPKWGIYGFWTGMIAALATAALLLVLYLERCSRWAAQHRAL